ncbi:MAG: hypothetical protein KGQ82_04965 [Alphaproteobacteria bacterium]|nr:hypothetical protein [Alphaproteobacteria bacterium]
MDEFSRGPARRDLDICDILKEGRRLVAAGWCQGAMAKDAQGHAIEASSPEAVAFDPVGAIERAVLNLLGGDRGTLIQNYYKGFYALAWGLHTHSKLSAWNDDAARLQVEVLERFDLALAQATRPLPHAPRAAA